MKTITSFATLVGITSTFFANIASADQHYVDFYYISNGVKSLSGEMVVPNQYLDGVPYLWPGLQPSNNQGVLQPVLDGRNQGWNFGINWIGNPSEPYGGGVSAPLSSTLGYTFKNSDDGNNNWYVEVSNEQGDTASYTYDLGLQMTQAIFDCELYGTDWNFGDVIFKNVVITGYGNDLGWCKDDPYSSSVNYKITGVTSEVVDNTSVCYIDEIALSPPSS